MRLVSKTEQCDYIFYSRKDQHTKATSGQEWSCFRLPTEIYDKIFTKKSVFRRKISRIYRKQIINPLCVPQKKKICTLLSTRKSVFHSNSKREKFCMRAI